MNNSQYSTYKEFLLALSIIYCLLFVPVSTQAITAELLVDTQGSSINALEVNINWPSEIKVESVSNADSVLTFWINQTQSINGSLPIAGIAPGGFSGMRRVLTLNGNFSADDLSKFSLSDIVAYANNASGDMVPVGFSIKEVSLGPDTDKPESFLPEVGQSEGVLGGGNFLTFATQDKGTGIDHYEVKEGIFGKFIRTDSPYLLRRQGLHQRIYVKAVDRSGNERVVVLKAPRSILTWEAYLLLGILIISGLVLWKKRNQ